jgi:hypothetical protein
LIAFWLPQYSEQKLAGTTQAVIGLLALTIDGGVEILFPCRIPNQFGMLSVYRRELKRRIPLLFVSGDVVRAPAKLIPDFFRGFPFG